MWCKDLTQCLTAKEDIVLEAVKEAEKRCFQVSKVLIGLKKNAYTFNNPLCSTYRILNKLAELVRGKLPKLVRSIIGALITIDVHARDIVTQMVENKASNRNGIMKLSF